MVRDLRVRVWLQPIWPSANQPQHSILSIELYQVGSLSLYFGIARYGAEFIKCCCTAPEIVVKFSREDAFCSGNKVIDGSW